MDLVRLPSCERKDKSKRPALIQAAAGSWWLGLLAAFLLIAHERGVIAQRARMEAVTGQLVELKTRREHLALERRSLQAKLTHGADPAWMEMVLMKELGLAPEGYRRVHFQPAEGQ